MNTTTEQRLATALRAALETIQTVRTCAEYEAHAIVREHDSEAARAALAAYDAQHATAPAPGLQLDDAERATVLAALRYYQREGMGDPMNRDDDIHDIATNGETLDASLDDDGIDNLCARLNA